MMMIGSLARIAPAAAWGSVRLSLQSVVRSTARGVFHTKRHAGPAAVVACSAAWRAFGDGHGCSLPWRRQHTCLLRSGSSAGLRLEILEIKAFRGESWQSEHHGRGSQAAMAAEHGVAAQANEKNGDVRTSPGPAAAPRKEPSGARGPGGALENGRVGDDGRDRSAPVATAEGAAAATAERASDTAARGAGEGASTSHADPGRGLKADAARAPEPTGAAVDGHRSHARAAAGSATEPSQPDAPLVPFAPPASGARRRDSGGRRGRTGSWSRASDGAASDGIRGAAPAAAEHEGAGLGGAPSRSGSVASGSTSRARKRSGKPQPRQRRGRAPLHADASRSPRRQRSNDRAQAVKREMRPYVGPAQPHLPRMPGEYAPENTDSLGPGTYGSVDASSMGPQKRSNRLNAPSHGFGRAKRAVDDGDRDYLGPGFASRTRYTTARMSVHFDVTPSIGKQAQSKRRTAPSASFGTAARFGNKSVISKQHSNADGVGVESPGFVYRLPPSSFTPSAVIPAAPRHSFGTAPARPKQLVEIRDSRNQPRDAPGPGAYSVHEEQSIGRQRTSARRNAPAVRIGTSVREKAAKVYFKGGSEKELQGTESPGPAAYSVRKETVLSGPAPSMGMSAIAEEDTSLWRENHFGRPGPGSHTLEPSLGKQTTSHRSTAPAPSFTQDDKHRPTMTERERIAVPAAGTYDTARVDGFASKMATSNRVRSVIRAARRRASNMPVSLASQLTLPVPPAATAEK